MSADEPGARRPVVGRRVPEELLKSANGDGGALNPPSFQEMWRDLAPVGRHADSGGYRRYAWSGADADCRAWFRAQAEARGLAYESDRNGNQWAWLGVASAEEVALGNAVVTGSHLDSVPDGGAFDGPLGVVSAFAALDQLRARGAHFTVPAGHRQLRRRGRRALRPRLRRLPAERRRAEPSAGARPARRRRDLAAPGHGAGGVRPGRHRPRSRTARPHRRVRRTPRRAGPRAGRPSRPRARAVGRRLGDLAARPLAVRLPRRGQPRGHHPDRGPPRPDAHLRRDRARRPRGGPARGRPGHLRQGRRRAQRRQRHPLPGARLARLARGRRAHPRRASSKRSRRRRTSGGGGTAWRYGSPANPARPSWSSPHDLRDRIAEQLGGAPLLPTGAGHDAGILSASVPTAMLYVRNPTGVSHSPAEFAEEDDCVAGVAALADVLEGLACR